MCDKCKILDDLKDRDRASLPQPPIHPNCRCVIYKVMQGALSKITVTVTVDGAPREITPYEFWHLLKPHVEMELSNKEAGY